MTVSSTRLDDPIATPPANHRARALDALSRLTRGLLGVVGVTVASLSPAALFAEDEVTTIEPGDPRLTGEHLQPYHARYRETRGGEVIGERLEFLQEARAAAGPALRSSVAMLRSGTVYDEFLFDRTTLAPLQRFVSSLDILHKTLIWSKDKVQGVQIARDGSAPTPIDIELARPRFAGSPFAGALLSLPLARNYEARFPIFSTDVPSEMADKLFQTIHVKDRRTVKDAGGNPYEAWIIDLDMTDMDGNSLVPTATLWLTDVPPYSVTRIQGESRVELLSVSSEASR